jgi:hypothetical protein
MPGPRSVTETRTPGPRDRASRRTDESLGENLTALESRLPMARASIRGSAYAQRPPASHSRAMPFSAAAGVAVAATSANSLSRSTTSRMVSPLSAACVSSSREMAPCMSAQVRAISRSFAPSPSIRSGMVRSSARMPASGLCRSWATVATISLRSSSKRLTRARATVSSPFCRRMVAAVSKACRSVRYCKAATNQPSAPATVPPMPIRSTKLVPCPSANTITR